MAAPEHVPVDDNQPVRGYESPPRRAESWRPNRPGEVIEGGQPRGERLGNQGPDQGYMLSLARRFEGKLMLTPGEHEKDALAGSVAVALKRASLYGRAPVVHDLTIALTIWGFLGEAPDDLVQLRKPPLRRGVAPAPLRRAASARRPRSGGQPAPHPGPGHRRAHRADWRSLLGEPSTAA